MMPKARKTDRKRDRSGKLFPAERGIDRGTAEIQARRTAWLGARAHPMERLSHENPIDIIVAHGWFEPAGDANPSVSAAQLLDAARKYQHHHTVAFGPLSAQAMALGTIKGRGITARRRLLIMRELGAWNRILEGYGAWANAIFREYVLALVVDDTIRAVVRAGRTHEIDGAYRMRVVKLRQMLAALALAPPVWVSRTEVELAEAEEGA